MNYSEILNITKTYNNYPAVDAIIASAIEGAGVDIDTALRIESRYFAQVATGQVSKNMLTAFWYQRNAVLRGGSRPQDIPKTTPQKVGVIGAGLMGHGIAYVSAKAGMEVVMKDVNQESANKGKAAIAKIMDKAISRKKMTVATKDEILDKILATGSAADFADCDLIIEAVFENRNLKAAQHPCHLWKYPLHPRGLRIALGHSRSLHTADRQPQLLLAIW